MASKILPSELDKHAAEIRRLGKRVVADIIEIGRRLTECKRIAGHGNFLPWLNREFGWSEDTAERFIQVAALSNQIPQLAEFNLPLSGLYLLASPSTPDEARTEIIERAQVGEPISVADVKQTIAEQRAVTSGLTYRVPVTVADMLPPKQKSVVYPPNPTWQTDEDDVSKFDTRTDSKGRQQPARKSKPTEADVEAWAAGDISRDEAVKRGVVKALYCSFCFKSEHNVDTLITNNGLINNGLNPICICNECVDRCVDTIKQKKAAAAHKEVAAPPVTADSDDPFAIPGFLDRTKEAAL
jgi:hypothetical protein